MKIYFIVNKDLKWKEADIKIEDSTYKINTSRQTRNTRSWSSRSAVNRKRRYMNYFYFDQLLNKWSINKNAKNLVISALLQNVNQKKTKIKMIMIMVWWILLNLKE